MTLRLPPENLNSIVWWLREQGVLSSEQIHAEDVSEQYYDLRARLDNARRFEARLQDMLKTQTGKLNDIMLVEEKLNQVREEIEQFEGKLRYFDSLVDLSTLTLHIEVQAVYTLPAPVTFGDRIVRSWQGSTQALVSFSQGISILVVALIPWIVPLVTLTLIARFTFLRLIRRPRIS